MGLIQTQAQYVQGPNQIPYLSVSGNNAGDVIVVGSVVGVTEHPIRASEIGALTIQGVVAVVKEPGLAFTLWEEVEWDDVNNVAINATGGGYTDTASIGRCVWPAATTDQVVQVLLNPYASSVSGA